MRWSTLRNRVPLAPLLLISMLILACAGCEVLNRMERQRARNILESFQTGNVAVALAVAAAVGLRIYAWLSRKRPLLALQLVAALATAFAALYASAWAPYRSPTAVPFQAVYLGGALVSLLLAGEAWALEKKSGAWLRGVVLFGLFSFGWLLVTQFPRAGGKIVDVIAPGGPVGCAKYERGGWWCWGTGGKDMRRTQVPSGESRVAVSDKVCVLRSGEIWCSSQPPELAGVTLLAASRSDLYAVSNQRLQRMKSTEHLADSDRCLPRRIGAVSQVALRTESGYVGEEGCLLRPDHTVSCWADERVTNDKLGEYPLDEQAEQHRDSSWVDCPYYKKTALTDTASLAAGGLHYCALDKGGAVRCWGYNRYGQLGRPRGKEVTLEPTLVRAPPFDRIAAADSSTCGRAVADRSLHCWGGSFGDTPKRLPLPPADDFYMAPTCTCVLAQGTVSCLGTCYRTYEGLEALRRTAEENPKSSSDDEPQPLPL